MEDVGYLMESEEESIRLEAKTDPAVVEQQALWAQIRPGMRVADLGCGCGKTTYLLYGLVQPGGTAVGIDVSEKRFEYAQDNYAREGIEFIRGDIWHPLDELGSFDFVWVRFVLEYFRSNGFEIVVNASRILKPGGTLCLIDLDHNCLEPLRPARKTRKGHCQVCPRFGGGVQFRPLRREKTLFLSLRSWL